jgi:hypothetical protein
MKVGDLVQFDKRFEKAAKGQHLGPYLVLRRDMQSMYKKYDDDSKWAAWHILEIATGKIHVQMGRDIEVINEAC